MIVSGVIWLVACSGGGADSAPTDTGPPPADTDTPEDTGSPSASPYCVTWESRDGSSVVIETGLRAFDGQGRVVLDERDTGDDGTPSVLVTTTYDDAAGTYTAVYEWDADDDGVREDRTETVVNTVNELAVSMARDRDGDGIIEDSLVTLAATEHGDPVDQRFVQAGADDERRHRAFDEQRRVLLLERDFGDDAVVDQRVVTTYDDTARLQVTRTDVDNDGDYESLVEVERDADGRVLVQRTDTPIGLPWEYVVTYTWEDGRLVLHTQEVGRYVTSWTYTYDAQGRPASVVSDNGFSTTFTVVDCP